MSDFASQFSADLSAAETASSDDASTESLDLGGEQAEGLLESGDTTVSESAEKRYLDADEYGDYLFKVDDGFEVPIKDLRNNVLMHRDYTQKTQELAEQRQLTTWAQALQGALTEDFDGTVAVLREAWGAQAAAEAVAQAQADPALNPDDPLARELAGVKSWIAAQEMASVRSQIEREVESLQAEYGEDFNVQEAAALATQRKIRLSDAQELLYARKVREDAKRQAQLAQKTEAKRQDSVVAVGGRRQAVEPAPQQFQSAREAALAAFAAHPEYNV